MAMGLGGEGIDMDAGGRKRALAIQGERGVKFASVIQPGTVKGLIFNKYPPPKLAYHYQVLSQTIYCMCDFA
jgi:hypothetical protein